MQIASEKLTEDNFHAWKFKITNNLKEKGYWNYFDGANEAHPVIQDIGTFAEEVKSLKDRYQGSANVMYWLSVSVSDSIVGHIQDANSPQDAWNNLIAFNATNTKARKIELKNYLNTTKKKDLSVNDYTLKIKALCESLSSTLKETTITTTIFYPTSTTYANNKATSAAAVTAAAPPPPPIAPISPLSIPKNRAINGISLDAKVKAKEEEK
ncbi:hypothetical protein L7F22_046097 [Adiantum nelumboides]|nr:hypothetical protein [Adiantum nelumboides]